VKLEALSVKRKKINPVSFSKASRHELRITYHGYYPAFLNLKGKRAVVIGGGKVAERKVLSLFRAGADVTVISPEITERMKKEKLNGRIKHIQRLYRKGDLKKAFLVIATTDSQEMNRKVSHDAPCLVNVVDAPALCSFIVPSVVKRGPLTIAISTSGISPAFSRSLRKELEKLYGPEFAEYLEFLKKIRKKAIEEIKNRKKRSQFLKSLASEKMLKAVRKKRFREALKGLIDRM